MVDGLLDTSIIIDVIRRYPAAENWIANAGVFGITPIVGLELLDGVQNKREVPPLIRQIKRFERVKFAEEDYDWATEKLSILKLSHNVGIMDCLIAAPADRLQLPLYTRNLRHFAPLLGVLAVKPY